MSLVVLYVGVTTTSAGAGVIKVWRNSLEGTMKAWAR